VRDTGQSPTNWHQGSATASGGTVACGTYQSAAEIIWTIDAKNVMAYVRASNNDVSTSTSGGGPTAEKRVGLQLIQHQARHRAHPGGIGVQRRRPTRKRHPVSRRRGGPRFGRPGVVIPTGYADTDHLAARCHRRVSRKSFQGFGHVAAHLGVRFGKRRSGRTRGRQHRQVVDKQDPGSRGALTQRAPHRAQRIEHVGQRAVARVAIQQLGYPATEQRQSPDGFRPTTMRAAQRPGRSRAI